MIPGNRNVKNRVVSIFDTGARPIKKGKQRSPTGFGYKTLIAENGDRVITSGKVYRGNPPDNSLLETSLENHEELFGRVPWGIATGRGFGSKDNEELCQDKGIERTSLPRKGRLSKKQRENPGLSVCSVSALAVKLPSVCSNVYSALGGVCSLGTKGQGSGLETGYSPTTCEGWQP